MSMRGPVGIGDLARFDCIIDARSPSEYALDHIPGAINCPVLDDEERAIVGTLYKQQGAFEARRVGGAMVAANLARHLKERFADMPSTWKPVVYCWRGGMRSGSMVTWWRMVGWDAQQLAGGYKRWRHHVIEVIDTLSPQLDLRVVCGATGSAKTRILLAMREQGAQVLDLEGLAVHKGSLLGAVPGCPQPSQKAFETRLAAELKRFDLARPVFVEAESRKIGRMALPSALIERMRAAECLEIVAESSARLAYLLRDYAYLGDDVEHLSTQLGLLKELQSGETIARWQGWARGGELPPLFDELMHLHYDPLYERSQEKHFHRWAHRRSVVTDTLDEAAVTRLASELIELGAR